MLGLGVDVGPIITVPMRSLDSLSDELLKYAPIHMLKVIPLNIFHAYTAHNLLSVLTNQQI
jgi:hypothetical protein